MMPTVYSPYTPNHYDRDQEEARIDLTQLPMNLLALIIYYVSPRVLKLSHVLGGMLSRSNSLSMLRCS